MRLNKLFTVTAVLAAMLMVGGIGAKVFAQDDICMYCEPKEVERRIEVGIETDEQVSVVCNQFDYEEVQTDFGYCSDTNAGDYRIIFAICNCPNNSNFFRIYRSAGYGEIVDFKLTILTPGVYWTDDQLRFARYASYDDACDADYEDTFSYLTGNNRMAYDQYDSAMAKADDDPGPAYAPANHLAAGQYTNGYDGSFPGPTNDYYGSRMIEYIYSKGTNLCTPHVCEPTERADANESVSCDIVNCSKYTVLVTRNAYQVTLNDVDNHLNYWWIDIPQLAYDLDDITVGDTVEVEIAVVKNNLDIGCCACQVYCSCTVELGILGCLELDVESSTIIFPYVLFQDETASGPMWLTGVAITNMSSSVTAAEMEVVFDYYDADGVEYTMEKDDFTEKVNAYSISQLLGMEGWTPSTVPPFGAGWLQVTGNCRLDGYQFNFYTDTDSGTNFGAGVLPRLIGEYLWDYIIK